MNFLELVNLVRDGYREASLPYKETREESLVKLPVFTHFVDLLPFYPDLGQDGHDIFASLAAGPAPTSVLSSSPSSSFQREMRQQASDNVVLELGCGCGEPVAGYICARLHGTSTSYLGIDLCETQVQLAKKQYPSYAEQFRVGEMLEFTRCQKDNSFCGVLSLFTVFHLPRATHIELFMNIKRIMKSGAPLLISVPEEAGEGTSNNWLGGSTMYWSHFSVEWYELTLKQLGFELIIKYKDVREFLGEEEVMYYLLFKVKKDKGGERSGSDANKLTL